MAYPVQEQVVYQADPNLVQTIQAVRHRAHQAGMSLLHRHVQIRTIDGQVFEGIIVHVDGTHIYLDTNPMPVPTPYRQFFGPDILTLVLYELLVITLLYL